MASALLSPRGTARALVPAGYVGLGLISILSWLIYILPQVRQLSARQAYLAINRCVYLRLRIPLQQSASLAIVHVLLLGALCSVFGALYISDAGEWSEADARFDELVG